MLQNLTVITIIRTRNSYWMLTLYQTIYRDLYMHYPKKI
jgi:hypothetical protein